MRYRPEWKGVPGKVNEDIYIQRLFAYDFVSYILCVRVNAGLMRD